MDNMIKCKGLVINHGYSLKPYILKTNKNGKKYKCYICIKY